MGAPIRKIGPRLKLMPPRSNSELAACHSMTTTGAANDPAIAAHPKPSPAFFDVAIITYYLAQKVK
jgi:hypothetical protein